MSLSLSNVHTKRGTIIHFHIHLSRWSVLNNGKLDFKNITFKKKKKLRQTRNKAVMTMGWKRKQAAEKTLRSTSLHTSKCTMSRLFPDNLTRSLLVNY